MNGFEVCNILKNDLNLRNIYIIFLTAKGQAMDKQKAIGAGGDFYITKPFNIKEILSKVSEVMGIALT
jgi:DNA-binding response OmpR family regulator